MGWYAGWWFGCHFLFFRGVAQAPTSMGWYGMMVFGRGTVGGSEKASTVYGHILGHIQQKIGWLDPEKVPKDGSTPPKVPIKILHINHGNHHVYINIYRYRYFMCQFCHFPYLPFIESWIILNICKSWLMLNSSTSNHQPTVIHHFYRFYLHKYLITEPLLWKMLNGDLNG